MVRSKYTKGILIFYLFVVIGSSAIVAASSTDPPDKTVRVIYLQPSDVPDDPRYQSGIANVMYDAQEYFLDQCGFTFKLNSPVCEVLKGEHPANWYVTTTNGDAHWQTINNMQEEIERRIPAIPADSRRSRWKIVGYINAKGNGGGGGGWVVLPKHDADGAAGYPSNTARWVGGMCHELGHCFGLPDATHTDGTVMSASFYEWPNCVFNAGHVTSMKNNSANEGFWFDQVGNSSKGFAPMKPSEQWVSIVRGNKLYIKLPEKKSLISAVVLYDLSGKRVEFFSPAATTVNSLSHSFPVTRLTRGLYICALEGNGTIIDKQIVKKIK